MIDLALWPALVLTAGLATRLRPLSDVRAKAAMPVAGKALIVRILEWLRAAGVRRVVLNLHHLPATITGLVGDGSDWDIEVRYSWEGRLLGSAGGPRHALDLLDADRFLIINGDTLTDCNLGGLALHHVNSSAMVTMAVAVGDVGRYGGVLVQEDGRVAGFGKAADLKSRATSDTLRTRPLHFIGVQAVDAIVFSRLPDEQPAEIVRTLYPALIAQKVDAVAAFESGAEFLDVGSPVDYLQTVATLARREGVAFDCGQNCRIDPSARVENTVLWDNVTVSRDAELIHCIAADGVVVPARSRFERCVLVAGGDGLQTRTF